MQFLNSIDKFATHDLQFLDLRIFLAKLFPELYFMGKNFSDFLVDVADFEIVTVDVFKFGLFVIEVWYLCERVLKFAPDSEIIALVEVVHDVHLCVGEDGDGSGILLGTDEELQVLVDQDEPILLLPIVLWEILLVQTICGLFEKYLIILLADCDQCVLWVLVAVACWLGAYLFVHVDVAVDIVLFCELLCEHVYVLDQHSGAPYAIKLTMF